MITDKYVKIAKIIRNNLSMNKSIKVIKEKFVPKLCSLMNQIQQQKTRKISILQDIYIMNVVIIGSYFLEVLIDFQMTLGCLCFDMF